MTNHLRATLLGLRHSWSVRLSIPATVLAAVTYVVLSHLIATGDLGQQTAAAAQGVSDIMLVLFLGALLTGVAVSQDFETKTVHDAVLAAPRGTIVAAKTLVFLGLVTALTLPYIVVTTIAAATGLEFAPVLPTFVSAVLVPASGTPLGGAELVEVVGLGLANVAWYAGQLAVALPFAFAVPKPAAVLGVGFGGGFALQGVASLLAQSEATEPLARAMPWGYAAPGPDTPAGDVAAVVLVGLAWVLACAVLAWIVFRRRDIA